MCYISCRRCIDLLYLQNQQKPNAKEEGGGKGQEEKEEKEEEKNKSIDWFPL